MFLSSLKEIKLDLGWLFEDFSREKNIEEMLQLDMIPINSWILIISYDSEKIIKYCAKKWPYQKFVTFSNNLVSSDNIYVFNMSLDEFNNNTNKDYENFVIKNSVGYRRVLVSNASPINDSTFKQIDKQLYKDYGNTLKSQLVIYTSANDRINYSIPHFKETISKFDGKTWIHTFSPTSDFNNN